MVDDDDDVEAVNKPLPDVPLPPGACFALALWDYEAKDNTELSFKEDNFIIVTSQDSPDWWTGKLATEPDSPSLMFPANYVEKV